MDLDFQNTFALYCVDHPVFLAFSLFCFYCGIDKLAFLFYWLSRYIIRRIYGY